MWTIALIGALVGVVSVVEVHAECAWVLWEKISFTETGEQAKKLKKVNKEIPRGKWEVRAAFPPVSSEHGSLTSFAFCVGALKTTIAESQHLWKGTAGENQISQVFSKRSGEASFLVFYKDLLQNVEYRCLPDTVNPNR